MGADALEPIIDEAVVLVSYKVARLEMRRQRGTGPEPADPVALGVSVYGDYRMTMRFLVGRPLFCTIADNMKRGQSDDPQEQLEYVTEYFNILCGRIVSDYNRKAGVSARFGIPYPLCGERLSVLDGETPRELIYNSESGNLKLLYRIGSQRPDNRFVPLSNAV